jgi:hypothetical protein
LVQAIRKDRAARLAAIWSVAGLVLFSLISGKQAHYLMPEFAGVALLFARAMVNTGQDRRGGSAAPIMLWGLGAAALAYGLGLIPASGDMALLTPTWSVLLFCGSCLFLATLGWRMPSFAAHAVMGLGLAVALHVLIATSGLYAAYDSAPIIARIKAAEPGGLAISGMPYNAEFNFSARLTRPVATPGDPAALKIWALEHSDGLLFGPIGLVQVSIAPFASETYNGTTYGFWSARDVAVNVLE